MTPAHLPVTPSDLCLLNKNLLSIFVIFPSTLLAVIFEKSWQNVSNFAHKVNNFTFSYTKFTGHV